MSASKGDLATGTPTGPSNDHDHRQSSPSTSVSRGKRRRCEFKDSTSLPEPCTKRRHLDSSPPFPPVDKGLNTSQIAAVEHLPSPEVTNSSKGPHDAQDWHIRGWVQGTEGSKENNPEPPPIEPYPDPDPLSLSGMPPVKRKPSQESLGPASSYGDDLDSIASTDAKSNFYSSLAFPTLLEQHGVYMCDSASGLDKDELEFCQELLSISAPHPPNSVLDESTFLEFFELTRDKSEQWLVKNMHPHIFPAPELLALRGQDGFEDLVEGCNDSWVRAIFPSYGKCPQPDSTIAFKWNNFSREEIRKLGIVIGLPSKYLARDDMFFPFITGEAKCDKQGLHVADRQNIYSMSVALEGIIDLFRRAGRLETLNGKALGLSMSYDNETVKMFAHHVVIKTQKPNDQSRQQPTISALKYRTILDEVRLSAKQGGDRWKPYDFFYNACLKFSERHLQRIKEAIALLPSPGDPGEVFQPVPSQDEVEQEQVGDGVFKKPRNGGVAGELRKQLAVLERQLEEQKEEGKRREEESKRREDESRRRETALQAQLDRLLQLLETKSR
ncbi:hypothetical protein B0A52_06079 [Exophiala mesophila]|uniref:DUF7924 domain-containing protein n=1 Tax=Exophiala mesophila TaxID=212818 RepID=A0A438N591_EXOME|nr:hypothetical protein B0A52_06079 [Exophiala mesophila]